MVFEDFAKPFKALIRFLIGISPHKCQFFREQGAMMGLKFIIKDSEPFYALIQGKNDAMINMKPPKISERMAFLLWYGQFLTILS